LHEEHCKVIVRFFLAAVEHFNDEAEEAWELYVEFLVVSDFLEDGIINNAGVMEKEVAFRGKFDFYHLWLLSIALN